MRMAIVLDQLCGMAGTERIAQYICEEFDEADVYTLAYNPHTTFPYFSNRNIQTTWLNRFVRSMPAFRWSFPVATYVMQSLNLRGYDAVLSCSATVAKYISAPKGTHICYCYIPTRALWHFEEYFRPSLRAAVVKPFLNYLRNRDYRAAQRVDQFIAISETSREYINSYYQKTASVIHCPVDLTLFRPVKERKGHYLIVSRLESWKKLEFAIEAFNILNLPLRVVGSGPEEGRLRAMAKRNVIFVGSVDDASLVAEYSEARAVVFPPHLEYGLIPLEANACGTPVICYGRGGVTETMIPVNGLNHSASPPTAVFFYEQTATALIQAVREFEACEFPQDSLIRHAERWSVPEFRRRMRVAVTSFANGSASFG
jgi:glycosyltransferase involved in cell wall biosynthesis